MFFSLLDVAGGEKMSLNLSNQTTNESAAQSGITTLGMDAPEANYIEQEKAQLEPRIHSGANWFLWIAALSIINSIILVANGSWSFLAGLGITQLIDGLAYNISEEIGSAATVVAMVLNLTVAGAFVVFGLQARKAQNWAFITGIILYALDGLIFVWAEVWFSVAFHVFALYCILQGFLASRKFAELEKMPKPLNRQA